MAFSKTAGTFVNLADMNQQIFDWASTVGWQAKKTNGSDNEFVLFSDATGQESTVNITPGKEAIWVCFSVAQHASDGGYSALRLLPCTFVDNFDTGTIIGGQVQTDLKGTFVVADNLPANTNVFREVDGGGTFIVTTDGSATENASWIGLYVDKFNTNPASQMQGMYNVAQRQQRIITDITGSDVTVDISPPLHWGQVGQLYPKLEMSQQSGGGENESVEVLAVNGNVITLSSPPSLSYVNNTSLIGLWVNPIILHYAVNTTGVVYKDPGGGSGYISGDVSELKVVNSVAAQGAPSSGRAAYNLTIASYWDDDGDRGMMAVAQKDYSLLAYAAGISPGDTIRIYDRIELIWKTYLYVDLTDSGLQRIIRVE